MGNKQKLFVKGNGVEGAYSFMHHQFHHDYQPDRMHTVRNVVKTVMNWLTGIVGINKLRQPEKEFKSLNQRKLIKKKIN